MSRRYAWPLLTLLLLVVGALAAVADPAIGQGVWTAGVLLAGGPVVVRTLAGMFRGKFAADIIASLSIVGAVVLQQPLAGLVIVLMQTGGEALEHYAEGRASSAVRALEDASPRTAHVDRGSLVEDIPATSVLVGDTLLVRPGDLVPCDGVVTSGESDLDTSSLTGEAVPRRATAGTAVLSGMANGLGSFRMRVTALAERSQYARIVQLVRDAQGSKAPLQRLADRYAIWFTPATIIACVLAVALSHDNMRALAILVVATPCPLILATPVAIIGGINRAARRFIIIRNGGALERLADVDTIVFDKTGTLTVGKPQVHAIRVAPGFDEARVLRAAAAVEEHSSHLLARVLVDAVRARQGDDLPPSLGHLEVAGQGVSGIVEGATIRVGARAFVVPACEDGVIRAAELEHPDATLRAYVSVDDHLAAVVEYADEVRPEMGALLAEFQRVGIRRTVLMSGDHAPIARALGASIGIHEAYGDLLPPDKAAFIERLQAEGHVVMMVGDGINDAPALSKADVGVALAAHGSASIAAEAADIILLVDNLQRVVDAIDIGRRTMRIARQSIWAGLILSGIGMVFAGFGALPVIAGAALQEGIDVAVIVNALRTARKPVTLRSGDDRTPTISGTRNGRLDVRNLPALRA